MALDPFSCFARFSGFLRYLGVFWTGHQFYRTSLTSADLLLYWNDGIKLHGCHTVNSLSFSLSASLPPFNMDRAGITRFVCLLINAWTLLVGNTLHLPIWHLPICIPLLMWTLETSHSPTLHVPPPKPPFASASSLGLSLFFSSFFLSLWPRTSLTRTKILVILLVLLVVLLRTTTDVAHRMMP